MHQLHMQLPTQVLTHYAMSHNAVVQRLHLAASALLQQN